MPLPKTVLVVDDDSVNRVLLVNFLKRLNIETIEANNGYEAYDIVRKEINSPDMILMDVMMPVMNGFEATELIKEYLENKLVPIIFVTAVTQTEELQQSLDAGGDDFVTKPVNLVLLRARMEAHMRNVAMHNELRQHRDELFHYYRHNEIELETLQRVHTRATKRNEECSLKITSVSKPKHLVSGDIFLANKRPWGGTLILVGDFTGHGLAAASSTLAVSELFFNMSKNGAQLEYIISEINELLVDILPPDMFLCAHLIDVDSSGVIFRVWSGGMPDVYLLDRKKKLLSSYPSKNIPLGIRSLRNEGSRFTVIDALAKNQLYLFSDGVTDIRNAEGNPYGENRLKSILLDRHSVKNVEADLEAFMGTAEQDDDITLVEIVCGPIMSASANLSPQQYRG